MNLQGIKDRVGRLFTGTYHSIRTKLLTCFLIVTLIPLFSLGGLSYVQSAKVINSQFGKYGDNAVAQLEQQTSSVLGRMKQTAETIYSYLLDPSHSGIGSGTPSTYGDIMEKNDFESLLKSLRTQLTAGIYIITTSGYYYGENNLDVNKLGNIPMWNTRPKTYAGTYWLGFYKQDHSIKSGDNDNVPVIGLAVPIHHPDKAQDGSVILIEENAEELLRSYAKFEADTHAHLLITSPDGTVVYETDAPYTPHDNDVTWTRAIDVNQWTMEARIPAKAFYQSSGVIRANTMVVAIVSCLLAFGIAYLFSSRFTSRIRTLKDSMQKVSFGKLDTRTPIEGRDELGSLDMSFNRMVTGVQTLIGEVEQSERLKKEAELRAFHYQINPHLLFNTLNSIQWKARLQGAEDIRQMLYHLTMVLEGNLNISQELVTLNRELRMIGHFLKIQEIRYGKVFRYEQDCDEALMPYLIPRMTLQPLFENIFFHAFTDGQGEIHVKVEEDHDELVLTLRDNGAGIKEEKLTQLFSPEMKRKGRGGLGVRNADQKFKLHFGPLYGLKVHSVKGEGTTITIRWPKKEESFDDESREH
ncbi:cache domain-containing sensor histidine kinase [Paenibacillus lautus]|uniref:cache domain-containing sensor histidine kinase n=1 Tax=Paenibacillus lautus TaxID=1401 RepID=UPI002DB9CC8D|nr:sensor histidine kinase [Paenibacillus lautus]MEC0260008.1 sensor histidine kinase [Paenibacillus lautus]